MSNSTNTTFSNLCEIPHTISSFEELTSCYKYFFQLNQTRSILEIILFSGTILANFTVVICILLKTKISTFDQIIVGHGNLVGFIFLQKKILFTKFF